MGKITGLKVLMGGIMLAAAIYAVLAAPGLLTDEASMVPVLNHQVATVRP